jgi:hypothetical protein
MRGGLRRYKGKTIVVHQPGSPSLRGVVLSVYRDCVVLAHASTLEPKAAVGGEAVIPLSPGVWWQANAPEPA